MGRWDCSISPIPRRPANRPRKQYNGRQSTASFSESLYWRAHVCHPSLSRRVAVNASARHLAASAFVCDFSLIKDMGLDRAANSKGATCVDRGWRKRHPDQSRAFQRNPRKRATDIAAHRYQIGGSSPPVRLTTSKAAATKNRP